MTESMLGRPFDDTLRRFAEKENIRITETKAPRKGENVSEREGVLHVVAQREGEWVVARFPVGLPRKE
ncbi:MAG: hypothetical protein IJN44_05610 [Clostridia bacterium]|nr:hypothetical protein [Clostridia bacterium]